MAARENPFSRVLDELKHTAKKAVAAEIDRVIPPSGESYEDDDEEIEDDGEVDAQSMAFEYESSEDNLAAAAAAYRILGGDGDIIGTHKGTGRAFFGTEDDLVEYSETVDLSVEDWEVYDNAKEIMQLEYDQNTMKEVLRDLRSKDMAKSREQYEGFHWGDKSQVVSVKDIPGLKEIDRPLTFLGVAREICYGAKKEGKFEEYYHEHGEESGTFPSVYALGDKCYLVCGGKMRIEDRGIVD